MTEEELEKRLINAESIIMSLCGAVYKLAPVGNGDRLNALIEDYFQSSKSYGAFKNYDFHRKEIKEVAVP